MLAVTSRNVESHNEEYDRLRGVAILWVLLAHVAFIKGLLPFLFWHSSSGVDLFFVLSGFLVTTSFLRLESRSTPKRRLQTFWTRRVYRIVPAALVWLIVPFVVSLWLKPGQTDPKEFLREMIAIVTLSYNYLACAWGHHHYSYYWSLMVEEHFYLLLPLALLCVRNRSLRITGLFALIILATLARTYLSNPTWAEPHRFFRTVTHLRIDTIAFGCLLAFFLERGKRPSLRLPKFVGLAFALLAAVAIGLLPGVWIGWRHAYGIGFVIIAVLSTLLVWLASYNRGYVFGIIGVGPLLSFIGKRAYSIYLSHMCAVTIHRYFQPKIFGIEVSPYPFVDLILFQSFLYWLILGTLTELSYQLVELPFLRRGRNLTSPKRAYVYS